MDLLRDAAERSIRFLETLPDRPVRPDPKAVTELEGLAGPLPDGPCAPEQVLARLDRLGSPATLGTAGPRFFGFVIGGTLPPTVAASWLAAAWDQNAGLTVGSPVASRLEEIALEWLVELAGLPAGTGGGFVTGATVANFTALAAARHEVLRRVGWDVEARGLYGAPEIQVIVGDEAHPTLSKAIAMLGLGRERVTRLPVDGQGRVRAGVLPAIDGPAILCLQAGNINTGAFDPMDRLIPAARDAGAWVHVDGAFGFWAAASRKLAPLARGMELADSWATDAHKWLNVPYDSGVALVRDPEALRRAMSISAAYLPEQDHRQPSHYTPELSRRARGVEIWTALATLGRAGVEEMIERCCRHASRFAQGLAAAGYEILNEVVLNQVLVSFGTGERTREVIRRIQDDGTCWCGGTVWQERTAMRISVSSWATTDEDVERSLEAMLRIAAGVPE